MKIQAKYHCYFFPLLLWALIYFVFSFDGLYGQDAYEYLRYTEALRNFVITGQPPGDYFWGVYYPILGALLSFIIPNVALALQLVSVLSLLITSLYLDKITQLVYRENELKNIPFLFFTLSPIVLIHSFLVMSDMLACCFTTVAIYLILRFLESSKDKFLFTGIAFALFATLTRYGAAVVLLPFCITLFVHLIKNKKYQLFLLAVPILILIAFPHLLIRSQNSLQFLSHQWLQTWNISNLLKSDFTTIDGQSHNHFINFVYGFFSFGHPIFIFPGILLLAFAFKMKNFQMNTYQKLILSAILLYALFLSGIPFQNKRFLLLSFPLVIVFLFPTIKQLFAGVKHPKFVFIFLFLSQISFAFYFGKSFYDRNILEKNIVQEMKSYQGRTLYVFDIDIAMQGRKMDFIYKNLWMEKYADFEKNALVLVNEKQLQKQWEGKNPLLNWERIQAQYQIRKIKTLAGDFNLYLIDAKK